MVQMMILGWPWLTKHQDQSFFLIHLNIFFLKTVVSEFNILTCYVEPNEMMAINTFQRSRLTIIFQPGCSYSLDELNSISYENSEWVWSGNTTITNRRQPHGTARKSHSTITRHQEDKLSRANSSLFPIKLIAILEWT